MQIGGLSEAETHRSLLESGRAASRSCNGPWAASLGQHGRKYVYEWQRLFSARPSRYG